MIDQIHNHLVKSSTTCPQTAYFIGRDFKQVRLGKSGDSLSLPHEPAFPFVFLDVDSVGKSVRIEADALGLFSYFYIVEGKRLLVANFLPPLVSYLGDRLQLSERSVTDLALFGTTTPGHTIFNQIHMSHPLENLLFSAEDGLNKLMKPRIRASADARPSEVYETFKSSVRGVLETSSILWLNITGGSDTRLILSTLSPEDRERYTFLFDEVGANPAHIPWDRGVIRILEKRLNLNVRYRFPEQPFSTPKGYFDRPEVYSAFPRILGGMFGGESLGGNAIHCLPETILPEQPSDAIEFVVAEREVLKERFRAYFNTPYDLAYSLNLFTNSFMSFLYDDVVWTHPYTLLQKKTSPFINTALLGKILVKEYREVNDYVLYYDIYRECAPELLEIPFFSRLSFLGFPRVLSLPEADLSMLHMPSIGAASGPQRRATLKRFGSTTMLEQAPFAARLSLMRRGLALSLNLESKPETDV